MSCVVCNPFCGRCRPPLRQSRVCAVCGTPDFVAEAGDDDARCRKCGALLPPPQEPETIRCGLHGILCANPCGRGKNATSVDDKLPPCNFNTPPTREQAARFAERERLRIR